MEITRPKKKAAAGTAPQLVIPSRAIVGHADDTPAQQDAPTDIAANEILVPLKRPNLKPAGSTPAAPAADGQAESHDDKPAEPEAAATAPAASTAAETGDTPKADSSEQPDEAAARAVQRERQLQEYISSKEYFIPIDAKARRRSLRVSSGLTFLILLLGVVLIDLMLDTGMIFLIQKIPHTHFFNVFN